MPIPESPHSVTDDPLQELDAISGDLVSARLNAEALANFPGRLPDTLENAYAIQSASIARWPDQIAGWKVGKVPESFRAGLAAERLAGPIFKSTIFSIDADSVTTMPIYEGGFAAIEAEFVFEIAADIEPTIRDYSDEELTACVSALHIGAEIASSPMAFVNKLGPCCVVSDFGNNAGLLVGPSIPNWSSVALESMKVVVTVDSVVVGAESANAIEGGLLQALRFLLRSCAQRGLKLSAGDMISTGAVTGIHDVTTDSKAHVDFGSHGSFSVLFEPMPPKQ
jgi:2-keto-4-pentenoate hydratase